MCKGIERIYFEPELLERGKRRMKDGTGAKIETWFTSVKLVTNFLSANVGIARVLVSPEQDRPILCTAKTSGH